MKTPPSKAALPILCLSLCILCVQAAPPPLPPEFNPQDRVKPAQVREMFAVLPPMEPPNHERSDSELRSRIVTLNSDWLPEPGGTTRAKLFEDAEFGFHVNLPRLWSIHTSPVPQSALISTVLAFPYGQIGDKIHRMIDTSANYQEYVSTGIGTGDSWTPSEPSMNFGEAFWSYKQSWITSPATYNNWTRVFWTSP